MIDIKKIISKSTLISLLVSTIIVVLCFGILIFRVGYPHHRFIAVTLYLVSWIFYVHPVLRSININRLAKLEEVKLLRKYYLQIIATVVFCMCLYSLLALFPIDEIHFTKNEIENLDMKTKVDLEYIEGVVKLLNTSVNKLENSGLLDLTIENSNPEKVEDLKLQYAIIVEQLLTLERFAEEYKYFYQINPIKHSDLHMRAFLIAYSGYVAKYNAVYKLSNSVNTYSELIINEEVADLNRKNTFHSMKTRFDDPDSIIRINSGNAYLKYILNNFYKPKSKSGIFLTNYALDAYDEFKIQNTIKVSSGANLDNFEKKIVKNWLPIQKSIAGLLGDTKITKRHDYFITEKQINTARDLMEPGDIFFQRRNWYVSNVGMPGFWTHTGLYTGSLEKLDEYFEKESIELYNTSVSNYLKENFPEVYLAKSTEYNNISDSEIIETIEAKSPGIVMISLEESCIADYLLVVRPNIPKKDKLKVLMYAFSKYGKPYDFDFDFSTDDSLVCSELVYKAYLTTNAHSGLFYDLTYVAGRPMIGPNDMVREFANRYNSNDLQSEFVLFLDGNEDSQSADFVTIEEFLDSHTRSKYTLLLD